MPRAASTSDRAAYGPEGRSCGVSSRAAGRAASCAHRAARVTFFPCPWPQTGRPYLLQPSGIRSNTPGVLALINRPGIGIADPKGLHHRFAVQVPEQEQWPGDGSERHLPGPDAEDDEE